MRQQIWVASVGVAGDDPLNGSWAAFMDRAKAYEWAEEELGVYSDTDWLREQVSRWGGFIDAVDPAGLVVTDDSPLTGESVRCWIIPVVFDREIITLAEGGVL